MVSALQRQMGSPILIPANGDILTRQATKDFLLHTFAYSALADPAPFKHPSIKPAELVAGIGSCVTVSGREGACPAWGDGRLPADAGVPVLRPQRPPVTRRCWQIELNLATTAIVRNNPTKFLGEAAGKPMLAARDLTPMP